MTDQENLQDLFSTLNQVSSGVTQGGTNRGGGGTGGGSMDSKGNMDGNPLLKLNPFISKNVTSFGQGGMLNNFAQYNEGGNVGLLGAVETNYSVAPHEQPNKVSFVNDGGREKNRINEIRRREFMEQNNLNPYHVQFTSDPGADSPYMKSFKAEQEKRRGSGGFVSGGSNPTYEEAELMRLKNPWEEGYDNWYGQAKNGMRMPEYGNGGMMPQQQMPQQTESYAKQANDMIALAQLEAFGKKFLSQMPQGQMPPEITQAMNQQGVSQAANGMKHLYQQGGNYPHNMYNKETGYKIVAQNEAAHTKLANAGFDHTPKAKYGMKMKRYTQGGRF